MTGRRQSSLGDLCVELYPRHYMSLCARVVGSPWQGHAIWSIFWENYFVQSRVFRLPPVPRVGG